MAHKSSSHRWAMIDAAIEEALTIPYVPGPAVDAEPSSDEQPSSSSEDFELSDHVVYPNRPPPVTPVKQVLGEAKEAATNTQFTTPTPTGSRKKVKYLDRYASNWTLSSPKTATSRHGMVKMTYGLTGATFNVLATKINKAQAALDPQTYDFLLVPSVSQCRCHRLCTQSPLTAGAVLNHRRPLWESDDQILISTARLLRSYNLTQLTVNGLIPTNASLIYKISDREVCGAYWATVMGISDHTLRRSRMMAKNGRFVTGHAGTGMTKLQNGEGSPTAEASDALKCHGFWFQYFEIFCQRPNDEVRLFPTAETFKSLYINNFLPYAARLGWKKIPTVKVFSKVASTHPDFADVKRKKNHTHCRCNECSDCKALLAAGFRNGEDLEAVQHRWLLHQTAIRDWRSCEHYWTQLSQSTPHEVITTDLPPVLLLFCEPSRMILQGQPLVWQRHHPTPNRHS
jgi:hypothetical protein